MNLCQSLSGRMLHGKQRDTSQTSAWPAYFRPIKACDRETRRCFSWAGAWLWRCIMNLSENRVPLALYNIYIYIYRLTIIILPSKSFIWGPYTIFRQIQWFLQVLYIYIEVFWMLQRSHRFIVVCGVTAPGRAWRQRTDEKRQLSQPKLASWRAARLYFEIWTYGC